MQRTIQVGGQYEVIRLFGPRDRHLKRLRDAFDVSVVARGEQVRVEGPDESVRRCEAALLAMEDELNRGAPITEAAGLTRRGAKIEKYYGFGPTLGSAFNVTLMSYLDSCGLGFTVDTDAVRDADVFDDCVRAGLRAVLES